jgi:hypothetical protein
MAQVIQWGLLILPWLSLIFIGKRNLLKYMPVALLVTVINSILYQAAYYYNWWRESGLFGWDNAIPIHWIYSAYLVATIWIFRFTYGRFWLYLLVNLALDAAYMWGWGPIEEKLGLASSESVLPSYASYAIMIGISLVIYLYQMWQDNLYKEPGPKAPGERESWEWKLRHREKAR